MSPACNLTEDAFRAEIKSRLSSFKVPNVVRFLGASELPMLSTSKLDRRALIEWLKQDQQTHVAA